MQIDIKTKNISLNQALRVFCEKTAGSLEKYIHLFETEASGWMEIGKSTLHHRKGPFFRAECQIFLPGKKLRSESEHELLRVAIIEVKDDIQRQLKEYKNKIKAKQKRGQRQLKKSLNLSPQARIKRNKGARVREEGI